MTFSKVNFTFAFIIILPLKLTELISTHIPCILILSKFFHSPTDAQVNCLKNNFKIYIKTAPTCFDAVTIIRERIIRAC
jgi:hypothetical protein